MGKFKTIHEDIETVTNKEVIKQNSLSMMGIGLMGGAVVLFIAGFMIENPNSSVSTFLFSAAVALLVGGLIKFFISRSCYLFRPTNSRLKAVTLYFDNKECDSLQACMEMKRFEDLKRLKRQVNTGIKVEAMVAGDSKFAAVQISEYIPYTYEAVTPVMCYYGEEAKTFVNFFK